MQTILSTHQRGRNVWRNNQCFYCQNTISHMRVTDTSSAIDSSPLAIALLVLPLLPHPQGMSFRTVPTCPSTSSMIMALPCLHLLTFILPLLSLLFLRLKPRMIKHARYRYLIQVPLSISPRTSPIFQNQYLVLQASRLVVENACMQHIWAQCSQSWRLVAVYFPLLFLMFYMHLIGMRLV